MSTATLTADHTGRTPVWNPSYPPDSPACAATRHGTYVAYSFYGCRCGSAREQYRIYRKRWREGRASPRMVDVTGTRRRLQALAVIGWSPALLATRLGWRAPNSVRNLMSATGPAQVNIRTAAAVCALYDDLAMTAGPSMRARRHAERAGWVPPLAWDDANLDDPAAGPAPQWRPQPRLVDRRTGVDHAAVTLACAGRLPTSITLTKQEREEIVGWLHRAGLNDGEIAQRVHPHLTGSGAQRIRGRLQLPALAGEAGWSR